MFEHRFHSSIVTSSGENFNQLNRAVQHNLRWKAAKKELSFAKKRLFLKNFKRHYLSSNQKLTSTQTDGSAFLNRIQIVQNSKYEQELLNTIHCVLDGYGFVISDQVNFSRTNQNI